MANNNATYKMRPEVSRYLAAGVTYDPLRQPLYDRVIFAAGAQPAGVTQFFATPVGQGGKTELDTNLRLAGQLPANHVFEVWSPRIVIRPVQPSHIGVATAADVESDLEFFMYGSFQRCRIVSQEKLLVPTYFLPAASGVDGASSMTAAAVNLQAFTNGSPTQYAGVRLDPFPIILPPLQQFTWSLEIPLTFTTQNIVHVWVVLDGILHRPALP